MEDATEYTQVDSVNRVAPSYLREKKVFLVGVPDDEFIN